MDNLETFNIKKVTNEFKKLVDNDFNNLKKIIKEDNLAEFYDLEQKIKNNMSAIETILETQDRITSRLVNFLLTSDKEKGNN
jgi:aminopeptidase C